VCLPSLIKLLPLRFSVTLLEPVRSYMDDRESYEEFGVYVHEDMGWPAIHFHHAPLLDNTQEGWLRDGWWDITGEMWQKGHCVPEYVRVCEGGDEFVAAWDEVNVNYDQPGIQPDIPLPGNGTANTWFGIAPVTDTDDKYRAINTFVEFEVDYSSEYGQWDGSYDTMSTGFPNTITTVRVCARCDYVCVCSAADCVVLPRRAGSERHQRHNYCDLQRQRRGLSNPM